MKVKEAIKLLSKQNPENDLFFSSPVASPEANIPVGDVFENVITMYTFSDCKIYSYIPVCYKGDQNISLTDMTGTILTDKIR